MSAITSTGFTLEETKEMRRNSLKAVRDYKETRPVEYNSHLYDFDTKSFDRINAARIALGDSGRINWTTADHDVVEVSAEDLTGVIRAAALRSNSLHTIYRDLKTAIDAAKTVEEVNAIQWPEE